MCVDLGSLSVLLDSNTELKIQHLWDGTLYGCVRDISKDIGVFETSMFASLHSVAFL